MHYEFLKEKQDLEMVKIDYFRTFVSLRNSDLSMDNYIVSARKYRPATFHSVVGQEALTVTLKNAIASNKLAHAFLFSGPRGVGKTTCARIFAKTINCLNPTTDNEACNSCESCISFNEQRSYNISELDAASNNGVDDIRALIEQVRIPPQLGRYKVYIIDEVHMLSPAAFNSFLKTLEEPPLHAIFILATTEKQKIIPTILSRCQVYDFNRIKISDIVKHLQYVAEQEGVKSEPEALNIIAQKADGGMRDALSIFDQTVSYTQGNITYRAVIENLNLLDYEYYFKLTDAILGNSLIDALLILNSILNSGFEERYIIIGITSHFRDLLVCKDEKTAELFQMGASIRDRYIESAKRCDIGFLFKAIEIANECDLNLRFSKNRRLLLELTLIKLCQLQEIRSGSEESEKVVLKPIVKKEKELQRVSKTSSPTEKTASVIEGQPTKQATAQTTAQRTEQSKKSTAEAASEVKKKNASQSGIGISISALTNKKKKEQEKEEKKGDEVIQNNNQFGEKELIAAWKEYAANIEKEKLVKSTMRLSLPKMIDKNRFEVEVNTEINREFLINNSDSILSFIREKVKNDNISMSVKISKVNLIKKALTSHEIFDEMVEKNQSLQQLSDEFGLELS